MSRRENRTPQEILGLPVGHSNNPDVAVLKIQVIAGLNLAKKDIFGLSDPYCTVKVFDGESRDNIVASAQTLVRKKTLNPQWGSTFHFRVDKVHHKLLFELYDENRLTRDDFLGEVELPLTDIPTESEDSDISYKEYLLQRRSSRSHVRGHLRLLLAFLQSNREVENTPEGEDNFIHVLTSESRVIEEPGWEAVNSNDPDLVRPHQVDRLQSRQSDTSADLPLPRNWEERQDANGRTFFLDHSTRTTHWERPNAIGEAPPTSDVSRGQSIRRHISTEGGIEDSQEDEGEGRSSPLPPGWEERVQADNGRTFYIDHNQHATTWTRPRGSSQCLTHISPPDTTDDEETDVPPSTQRLHPDVPSASEMPLPAGWAMQLAPNGRVFFIDHNTRNTSWVDPRIDVQQSSGPDLGPLPAGWEERVHTDGRIFFIDHNTQSTQWEDPRVQKMNSKLHSQAVPYSRDYKRKYDFFRSRLRKPVNVPNKYEIHVRRNNILEDSYRSILANVNNTDLLKTKLWIVFDGEVGLDYGGVSREFFFLLSKEIFNPYYGLFEYSATDNYTLQINPNSGLCNDEHLSYFKFIGRVAGMAVYHGKLLDAFFIRPFYKMMLHKSIVLADMESVDSEYFNSLKWLQMNDPEPLDLRFQVEEEAFGQVTSRVLKPGGEDIIVTEKNKLEYIDLVIKWRFVDRVGPQMKKFIEGFNDLIPGNLVRIFDERELEYLLCGLGEIDLEDWRRNTNYRGGYHDRHVVIQWFWKAVSTFDNEMRARFLQFATGTSRVPMNGFAELYGSNGPQKFTIERWGNAHSLPRAHTCFNRVDLPPYTSYHELREKLRLAVENTEGFEGVD